MTVEENLALAAGRGGWLSHVSKADKKAFRERVAMLDMGLENRMNQPVGLLSGGQRQRLTIARALVSEPDILILDDSSSALDFATDAKLRKSLDELGKSEGLTLIAVSQRASSVMYSDIIVVMDDGKIEAVGSHDELMKSSQIYREIYSSQNKEDI